MKSREERIVELVEHLNKFHYTLPGLLQLPEAVLIEIHRTAPGQASHPGVDS